MHTFFGSYQELMPIFARDVLQVGPTGLGFLYASPGVGAFLAMWSARLLTRWLYDVNPADVTSLLVAELILVLACVAGCLVPALRAARADPLAILRAT